MKLKIEIDALDIVHRVVVEQLPDKMLCKDSSADYDQGYMDGFLDFRQALLNAIDRIRKGGAENGRTSDVCENDH